MRAEAMQERQSTDRSSFVEPGVQEHSAGEIPTQKGIKQSQKKQRTGKQQHRKSYLQGRTKTHPSSHDQ